MMEKITAYSDKIVLSSKRKVYKTEDFINETRRTLSIDAFVSRIAEAVFSADITLPDGSIIAKTEDGLYTLFFCGGRADKRLSEDDIVFYKFLCAETSEGGGTDRRLREYLSAKRDKALPHLLNLPAPAYKPLRPCCGQYLLVPPHCSISTGFQVLLGYDYKVHQRYSPN